MTLIYSQIPRTTNHYNDTRPNYHEKSEATVFMITTGSKGIHSIPSICRLSTKRRKLLRGSILWWLALVKVVRQQLLGNLAAGVLRSILCDSCPGMTPIGPEKRSLKDPQETTGQNHSTNRRFIRSGLGARVLRFRKVLTPPEGSEQYS